MDSKRINEEDRFKLSNKELNVKEAEIYVGITASWNGVR